ncbi:MAG: HAD-IC family P-type ATPase, partial [Bdellovibrionaceae bacterium]|nr:HAD-IC family P-type ATPase [Pseudobdellovibrionaceae bacterium]
VLISVGLLTATGVFLWFFKENWSEGFNRALALIVVACPCALAFGTPLTFGFALKKAREQGILLKEGSVFERLLKVRRVVLDKTGTFTSGDLKVIATWPSPLPQRAKEIFLGLEAQSNHPIAFALRKAWPETTAAPVLITEEVPGQGPRGHLDGEVFSIRRAADEKQSLEISLYSGEREVARVKLDDEVPNNNKEALRLLRKKEKLEVILASGDRKERVLALAREIAIDRAYGELTPLEKNQIVQEENPCLMIGDGANDALALKNAFVGVAVRGSVDMSLQSADAYLLKPGLSPVLTLLALARRVKRTLVANLGFAFVYNLVAGTAAIFGMVDPLVAAVLMPVASVVIALNTWWSLR